MLHRKRLLALTALLFAPFWMGCAKAPAVTVPDSLLVCRDEPRLAGQINDPLLGEFIIDLVEAGADCRGKLRAVRGLVRP
jgi:hypothetical protein